MVVAIPSASILSTVFLLWEVDSRFLWNGGGWSGKQLYPRLCLYWEWILSCCGVAVPLQMYMAGAVIFEQCPGMSLGA